MREDETMDLPLDDAAYREFFRLNDLPPPQPHPSLLTYWQALPWQRREECAWTYETLREGLLAFRNAGRSGPTLSAVTLEVLPGQGKGGEPERFSLHLRPGDVVAIVGPTGSGKSRLLADLECLAQGDTPSRRMVLVNGAAPDRRMRFTAEGRLVAQITQNMNFVMDLRVTDFLTLHAESRRLADPAEAARRVLDAAIGMAGEPFTGTTPLTQLSGGQSRALMIADAALLSPKPVVLIDEIENAGVDRTRALKLFTDKGKIVLLSTHDPLLALSSTRRLVIGNGAVTAVIETSEEERHYAEVLRGHEQQLGAIREAMRHGHRLASAWSGFIGLQGKCVPDTPSAN